MNRISISVVANLVGRGWSMLMGLALVPLYLKLLGIEAYGLIGLSLTIQSVFGIMDLGFSLTLNREFARGHADPRAHKDMAVLLRTLELPYWVFSIFAGLLIIFASPLIASHWVRPISLGADTIIRVIAIMGATVALQMPFSFYQGGLLGLQHQVALNVLIVVGATLRSVGVILVLLLISRSIEAYFIWQLAVSACTTGFCAWYVWRLVPSRKGARFEFSKLKKVWRYSSAVAVNALLGLALSQSDKIILSGLLTLQDFGYYTLASSVAAMFWGFIVPINTALFPRFAQLYEAGETERISALYHATSQLMVIVLAPLAAVLFFYSKDVLLLWTQNPTTAENTYVLLSLLVLGTVLNGLASVGCSLQAAVGWPGLVLRTNFVSALILVPSLFVVLPRYGAVGAAAVWVLLNSTYMWSTIPLMHRRILRGELLNWFLRDVSFPVAGMLLVVTASRAVRIVSWAWHERLFYLASVWLLAVSVGFLISPNIRKIVWSAVQQLRRTNHVLWSQL